MSELRIIAADELKEVLRKHGLWLENGDTGERADLRYADLRYANLRSANLSYADLSAAILSYANLILIGQDVRGYLFWAYQNDDGVIVIRAGCRTFMGIAAAYAHWTAAHTKDEILHADCLSLVGRCEVMAKVRGWKLEAE